MNGRSSTASTGTSSQASDASTTGRATAAPTTAKLRVSFDSGDTIALDVPDQLKEWDRLKADPAFHGRVRGFVLVLNGRSYALIAPRGFRRVLYNIETVLSREPGQNGNVAPAAVRASYVADAIQATMTLYLKDLPPMVRFDVKLTGKLRWQAP